ncbi:hypothetical protein K432DRAFT_406235 [Lepidopterella palustris CBS 459.81]|uniref:Uncharacterized protein n=1 Tax=Lepidopterella palustris CBS 459.81 TaxID=1314670 RepID=A0A8E2JDK3_9PEZI|nr:hypothetical protein K432DRAFT_406235 [Lepidopterella palustris CBS 459.81]
MSGSNHEFTPGLKPTFKPIWSFLSLNPLRPVIVFSGSSEASQFLIQYQSQNPTQKDAHILSSLTHQVRLPMPNGLESVHGAENGETAFVFRKKEEGENWIKSLGEVGIMHADGKDHERTVFIRTRR